MRNALLVEDSGTCRRVIRKSLEQAGLVIAEAENLAEAFEQAKTTKFDFVLLDLGLPDGSGLDLLPLLQSGTLNRDAHVFVLSVDSDIQTKVSAFSLGVEDYLIKPVHAAELRARIEMRIQKIVNRGRRHERLEVGGVVVDMLQMKAFQCDDGRLRPLSLTSKEFRILAHLAINRGQTYSRADLLRIIWGDATHVISRTVDTHICALRRKLGRDALLIECVQGSGYRIALPEPTSFETRGLGERRLKG